MKFLAPLFLATVLALSVVTARSQPYELNWSDRNVPSQTTELEQAPPPSRSAPETRATFTYPKTLDDSPAPMTVCITAQQSYDHYENRYRKVARVESLIYRGGYPQDTVHCNRARYDAYDVYLNDLEVGDRYKVRVTWDDGSHRTIERTIGTNSVDSIVINEPLAYDNSFES